MGQAEAIALFIWFDPISYWWHQTKISGVLDDSVDFFITDTEDASETDAAKLEEEFTEMKEQ